MARIPGIKPNNNKGQGVEQKEPCKYDSLVGNTPYVSENRFRCHPRNGLKEIEVIQQSTKIICSDDTISGFPIKELEGCKNKELTYIVEVTRRIINELQRWIDEKMSEELYHYYVYNEHPCEQRLITIGHNYRYRGFENENQNNNIGDLITQLHYYKPQLGDTVKNLYDELVRKAKETDSYYKRLSQLPYWNEKNFNPFKVKQSAEALRKKLLHIQSMVYKDSIETKGDKAGAEKTRNKPESKYGITKGPKHWEFHYLGGKAIVDGKLRGLKMLEILLSKPDKGYFAKELRMEAGFIPKTEVAFKPIDNIDEESIKNLQPEAIEAYLNRIDDPAERAEIKDEIENYKRSNINLKGKSRTNNDSHRKSVSRVIGTVLDHIKGQCKPLYNHFDTFLPYGIISYYKPDREIFWEIL